MAGLFHDPSIGNPIHITIVRLILLEDEEVRSHVTLHCPWDGHRLPEPFCHSPEPPCVEGHSQSLLGPSSVICHPHPWLTLS